MTKYATVIDSHCHWGPSLTMGTEVTTKEVQRQQNQAGVTHVAVLPFPSTAIANNVINVRLLDETEKVPAFIPYHYIRENYDSEPFDPIPESYYGGKWHWMRGVQDSASNYDVLDDKALPGLIEKLRKIGKPIIFEEELVFTERFVEMAGEVPLIIPHLGLLGGNQVDFFKSLKDFKDICFDKALASKDMIMLFIDTVGTDRVLFASDVPFGSMVSELSKVMPLPISDEDKEKILYMNFVRLTKYRAD
jgi:uncharacterized protein